MELSSIRQDKNSESVKRRISYMSGTCKESSTINRFLKFFDFLFFGYTFPPHGYTKLSLCQSLSISSVFLPITRTPGRLGIFALVRFFFSCSECDGLGIVKVSIWVRWLYCSGVPGHLQSYFMMWILLGDGLELEALNR